MRVSKFNDLVLVTLAASFPWTNAVGTDRTSHFLLGSSFGIPINQTFDYVVVGGGSAGLTIAARLAEKSANLVAVIEAGSFYEIGNGNLSQIPADMVWFAGKDPEDTNPLVDWSFVTTPQAVS
jgi:choline dehydrogenase